MQSQSSKTIEHFLQKHILSSFTLPDGKLAWQGYSELNAQSNVYYFCINADDYILVNEPYHSISGDTLANSLIGNVVPPHQKVILIPPKESTHFYVSIPNKYSKSMPGISGDFSLFHILEQSYFADKNTSSD